MSKIVVQTLVKREKQNIKRSLNPQYRGVFNTNWEVTEYLLRDNVQKGTKGEWESA